MSADRRETVAPPLIAPVALFSVVITGSVNVFGIYVFAKAGTESNTVRTKINAQMTLMFLIIFFTPLKKK